MLGFDAAVPDWTEPAALVAGDVRDRALLQKLIRPSSLVIHLATGQRDGWDGLLAVDMLATKLLLDTAVAGRARRVVIASSNHVVGGFELDFCSRGTAPGLGITSPRDAVEPTDPIRPDSEYGAAKAFAEAYGRYVAETTALKVSCLRIGTVAHPDDPSAHAESPGFRQIPGGREGVERRLRATWLYHDDLVRILREEIDADERFRLRFAVSDNPGRFWSLRTYRWNGS